MLRVGLIGFGMSGRVFHGPLLSSVEGVELTAVMERSSNEATQRYPGLTVYRLLDQMLEDDSLNLLVLATPSTTHFELAQKILQAGKNLLVDKPVATESGQIASLMELARKKGVRLIPFQNRRWDGDYLTVKKLLAEEAAGRLVYFESRMDRWRPVAPTNRLWKEDPASGGVLLDLGTHLVDQALMLFGKPLGVSAEVLREREWAKVNDGFEIRLRYSDFTVALGANSLSLPAGPRYLLRGTKGNYLKLGLDPQEAALNKVTRISDPQWGHELQREWGQLHVDVGEGTVSRPVETLAGGYRKYYELVRDAFAGKCEIPVKPVEAWRNARVLEWAEESSAKRCEVVCDWSKEPIDEA